jgi:hypothetical protein
VRQGNGTSLCVNLSPLRPPNSVPELHAVDNSAVNRRSVAEILVGLNRQMISVGHICVCMNSAPEFFLPPTSFVGQEDSFVYMARGLNRPVPPIGERVYSISFESDGTLWIATVGERLRGQKAKVIRGKTVGWEDWWFDDTALVLAIFPPVPHFVVVLPDIHSHFRGDASLRRQSELRSSLTSPDSASSETSDH